MTMPSNKWEEALEELYQRGWKCAYAGYVSDDDKKHAVKEAKLALTNAVRAIVIDATPDKYGAESWQEGIKKSGYDRAIATYQANLLKAIGEKTDE